MRRTKIVCTLGPACSDEKTMEEMLRAGMNVARFNFSHGDHAYHKKMMDTFRRVRDRLKVPAALMLDTKGPEIRLGLFEGGRVDLHEGDSFTLTIKETTGNAERAYINFPGLPAQVDAGVRILIDDGRVALVVTGTTEDEVHTKVEIGGTVSDRKSINLPNHPIEMPYIGEKDEADLLFAVREKVDFVAATSMRF